VYKSPAAHSSSHVNSSWSQVSSLTLRPLPHLHMRRMCMTYGVSVATYMI
jgi:hypothetical protein